MQMSRKMDRAMSSMRDTKDVFNCEELKQADSNTTDAFKCDEIKLIGLD